MRSHPTANQNQQKQQSPSKRKTRIVASCVASATSTRCDQRFCRDLLFGAFLDRLRSVFWACIRHNRFFYYRLRTDLGNGFRRRFGVGSCVGSGDTGSGGGSFFLVGSKVQISFSALVLCGDSLCPPCKDFPWRVRNSRANRAILRSKQTLTHAALGTFLRIATQADRKVTAKTHAVSVAVARHRRRATLHTYRTLLFARETIAAQPFFTT